MIIVCGSKTFNKFQTFEGNQYFSPDFRKKKQLTYKTSKERNIAIASVVELDNMSSNLRIIMLSLITESIFKYKSPYSSITMYTDQCTDRWY